MNMYRVAPACALALVMAAGEAAAAVDLLSHRAAYRLRLANEPGTAGLIGVRGGLVIEWHEACDGWISTQRLGFLAETDSGESFTYDVRFSSWESTDNTELRFDVRSFDDGELFEAFSGTAALDEPAGGGQAFFDEPSKAVLELPEGTMFPTEHLRALVKSAGRGERVVTHAVFDGSGPGGLTSVTAVIGGARMAARAEDPQGTAEGDVVVPAAEAAVRQWPMSLAYHELDDPDGLPAFEISFAISERGVLDDLVLDYGDFALEAELDQIEELHDPRCQG